MLDLTPADLIARIVVLIVAFTVHEFAHAFVADRFGDNTPRSQGRLTLNPLVHLDPLGSLLLLVAGFGWAKPVEINPYALERRSKAAPMLVALAGPASNMLLAALAALPIRLGLVTAGFYQPAGWFFPSLSYLLGIFILLNLILMLFNLIPLFPLDGEKVLYYLLPPAGQAFLQNLRPYGSMILLAVVFLLPYSRVDVLSKLIFDPAVSVFQLLVGR